jgi:outer membrane receptor for ferrienterochelin and colicin
MKDVRSIFCLALLFFTLTFSLSAQAGIDGAISGSVLDNQGIAVPGVAIQLKKNDGTLVKEVRSSTTGDYQIFPVTLGDYILSTNVSGFTPFQTSVHVSSDSTTQADIHLATQLEGKEMVLNVQAKRHAVQSSASTSTKEVTQEDIEKLPQGEDIKLPKLIATTTPGVVQGPFGQTFIRGNHANIQYQIDGVQLPDSPSNTFGEAFTPRNIDHMEVITGGVPAEYGDRLAAVVNIVTKTGPENPAGAAELNYGSYNTFAPWATYGGSNSSGDIHYFASAQYSRTDRGLDTPQPQSETNQSKGGTDAIHDSSNGNNQFVKVDWLADNDNKLSAVAFNSYNFFEIPNYPSNFSGTDPFFQPGFPDAFGNGNPSAPTYVFVPSNTNDTQAEDNAYLQLVWKHTFTDHSFLQIAPYYKYSWINVTNDPANDLASANPPFSITNANPSSFAEDRHVNNFGIKSDFTDRINDRNFVKAGFQLQDSRAAGSINVISQTTGSAAASSFDTSPTTGYFESVYAQDDFTITKQLILNIGMRWDATQFHFSDVNSADYLFQPRIGLNYLVTQDTKLHVFYGKLFQPAPVENLRDTFAAVGGSGTNALTPFDIKAEKDDYFEAGVAQQIQDQVVSLNAYYKRATNMLDDSQLLNTSIAQPYNFAHGYAYGIELAVQGKITDNWSDNVNYSYEIAKGQGISGGLFAFAPGTQPSNNYQFLDHVQIHTANAGVSYTKDSIWWSTQGLFGSGLRTGPSNTLSLPSHFTMDTTLGYEFHGDTWLTKAKVSVDLLNIFNNGYPITIANGFNGSHYAAGREYLLHLTKEL